jgi:hypothetical protein
MIAPVSPLFLRRGKFRFSGMGWFISSFSAFTRQAVLIRWTGKNRLTKKKNIFPLGIFENPGYNN